MTARIKALDLFAGTGWGVACKRLGIKEMGVEIMPEAIATRTANGMETVYNDVWDGLQLTEEQHRDQHGPYGLLIASPPCQTFSLAGKGAGRAALDEVLEAIELHAYKDADALLAFGEKHDMRTALVLTPLAYVWRDMPKLVALEQVPTVLPVWEACAEVMREWGYEVKVEVLNAEQYGVPQTRKRAILVARRGGPVDLPTPTHSRYYSRTPGKLDPGVKKWVSMAEALGWGGDETQWTGNNKLAHQSVRPLTSPAATITAGHDSGNRGFIAPDGSFTVATIDDVAAIQSYPGMLRSNYGSGGDASRRGERTADQPAPTLTSKADRNKWDGERNVTIDEAAALQTYPTSLVPERFSDVMHLVPEGGNWRDLPDDVAREAMGGAYESSGGRVGFFRRLDSQKPSPTIVGSPTQKSTLLWHPKENRSISTTEAAALQSYPSELRPEIEAWKWKDAPATTIAGDPRITAREHHFHGEQSKTSLRLTKAEAVTLQTYEPPFVWCGTKTKQFLQIGNAVPPLLAEHILAALIGIPTSQASS